MLLNLIKTVHNTVTIWYFQCIIFDDLQRLQKLLFIFIWDPVHSIIIFEIIFYDYLEKHKQLNSGINYKLFLNHNGEGILNLSSRYNWIVQEIC